MTGLEFWVYFVLLGARVYAIGGATTEAGCQGEQTRMALSLVKSPRTVLPEEPVFTPCRPIEGLR